MIPTTTLAGGVTIPVLGLGTFQLTGETCTNAIKEALKLGYTHIDTANIYGNHKEVGIGIKDALREDLFITSKLWMNELGISQVSPACEAFLKDLKTEYLDLLLIHWPNKKYPLEETLQAMKALVDEGKIKSIGISNFPLIRVEEAIKKSPIPISVNQVEFHPLLNQKNLLAGCENAGVKLVAYSPLARGKVFENKTIKSIATKHNVTPSQVALRWLLDKGIIIIPKASSKEHLEDNLKALDLMLDKEDTDTLDNLPQQRVINPDFAEYGEGPE